MSKLTTRVASSGTSNVAMNNTKNTPRPGNSKNAKAYAASTADTTWNTVTITATTSELKRYLPRLPAVHASTITSNVNGPGSSGWSKKASAGLKAAMTVV